MEVINGILYFGAQMGCLDLHDRHGFLLLCFVFRKFWKNNSLTLNFYLFFIILILKVQAFCLLPPFGVNAVGSVLSCLIDLRPPAVVPGVVHDVVHLLYPGSFVFQTDEPPVCRLGKVPQVLPCDWVMACLQVTFLFVSFTNQQPDHLILSVRLTIFCAFFKNEFTCFSSYVIVGLLAIYDLLLCVLCDQFPRIILFMSNILFLVVFHYFDAHHLLIGL